MGCRELPWLALLCTLAMLRPSTCQSPGIQLVVGDAPSPTPSTASSQVRINEVVLTNKNSFTDANGDSPSWVELYNTAGSPVNLQGYQLTVSKASGKASAWTFPAGVSVPGNGYLLILADGLDTVSGSEVHAGIKLSGSSQGLSLLDASGASIGSWDLPELADDQAYGVAEGDVQALDGPSGTSRLVYLSQPTPTSANSGAADTGPVVARVTEDPAPRPNGGSAIPISAVVTPQQATVAGATLTYVIGYGSPVSVDMAATGGTYTADIPAAEAAAGQLVRWYVTATDAGGRNTVVPAKDSNGAVQYFGTIVADPTDSASLPILELYSENDRAPFSTGPSSNAIAVPGGKGDVTGCSVWFNGTFYDNVSIRRRGATSLGWPKPKIKIKSENGKVFKLGGLDYEVSAFGLNSNWFEPGANTFTREPLVWEAFNQMGVESLLSFHVHVRFNGKYFGRFSLQEEWSKDALERNGFDTSSSGYGPFWKSNSGIGTNLRFGVTTTDLPVVYELESSKSKQDAAVQALEAFTAGLAGGGPVARSKYLFDAVNLPQVINYLAAQTLILNQDRCTKNYFVYRDRPSGQWSMLPWDVESGFGIDRGLGGVPAPDYCILACDQWNSPLYCDRNHVQDLTVSTPWTLILSNYSLGTSSGVSTAGRRLLRSDVVDRQLLQAAAASGGALAEIAPNGAAEVGLKLPLNSTVPANAQDDQTLLGTPPTGANGTYNYMLDAVLSFPRTRSMYMRRLRSLMDEFTNGRLEGLVTSFYEQVKEEATRDNAKWGNPGTPLRGYQSLTTEQLPIRKQQLYNTFGVDGPIPLIPDAQPSSYRLNLGSVSGDAGGYVELVNPNDFAIDLSDAKLSGAAEFTFAKGTTVAAGDSVHVAADVGAFVKAKGGAGLYVVGPFSGSIQGPAASVSVQSAGGDSLVG
uniref:LTD domain-containing protein n=1 Tax=Auxenochlorella protothecoides TaxID=3075 RepID=A0A1D1ZRX4_AUXPR